MAIRILTLSFLILAGSFASGQQPADNAEAEVFPVLEQSGVFYPEELDRCKLEPGGKDQNQDVVFRISLYRPGQDINGTSWAASFLTFHPRNLPLKKGTFNQPIGIANYDGQTFTQTFKGNDDKGGIFEEFTEVVIDSEVQHMQFFRRVLFYTNEKGVRTETNRIACGRPLTN